MSTEVAIWVRGMVAGLAVALVLEYLRPMQGNHDAASLFYAGFVSACAIAGLLSELRSMRTP